MADHPVHVAALYQFTPFADPEALRAPLQAACDSVGVKGTLLLAREGINGTIAGSDKALTAVLGHIRALPGCADLDVKFSAAPDMPFHRLKVRVKREIVTMGEPDIDPTLSAGHYVDPHDWNALIADPETIVIDTRNDYEVAVGTFAGAVDPQRMRVMRKEIDHRCAVQPDMPFGDPGLLGEGAREFEGQRHLAPGEAGKRGEIHQIDEQELCRKGEVFLDMAEPDEGVGGIG
jgi:predicted sulfurtransferase